MSNVHSQQYSLRWNNYLRHITYAFENLRTNDDFVDVTLCCDGHKIKAHKVLLSACSGYFKEIFKDNPHPHPIIIFKFIKYEDLNSIIEFMYQGEVNVQQEALQSFLQTAELLAVQGLTSEEKPKGQKSPVVEENIIKNIPSSIRTVTETNATQTQTIELQTVQTVPIQNILKKRKIQFNEEDDATTVYTTTTTEPVELREESRNIVKEMQYLPGEKIEIPEYIDVTDCTQIDETTPTSQTDPVGHTQSVAQFTSEYEILTESEIDEKFQPSDSGENADIIQMDRLLTSEETIERSKEEKAANSQDLPNSKWTECQFCKMVITTVNLWRHIRTQHTPQPPRKCDHCQKNFKNKYSLREHIRISHEQKITNTKDEN